MEASLDYDYIVINDDLDKAALMLQSIVLAERCKVSRNKKYLRRLRRKTVMMPVHRFTYR